MSKHRRRAFLPSMTDPGKWIELPADRAEALVGAPRLHGWRPDPIFVEQYGFECQVDAINSFAQLMLVTVRTTQARKVAEGVAWLNGIAAILFMGMIADREKALERASWDPELRLMFDLGFVRRPTARTIHEMMQAASWVTPESAMEANGLWMLTPDLCRDAWIAERAKYPKALGG